MTVVPPEKGLAGLKDVDMVVEVRHSCRPTEKAFTKLVCNFAQHQAVSENLDLKKAIFRSLSAELNPHSILASNTSSISITKIASATIPDGQTAASEQGQKSAGRVVGE